MPIVLRGAALHLHVIAIWNRGKLSMAEIGTELGVPRNSIARILCDARKAGALVLKIDSVEATRRRIASWEKNDPAGFKVHMARMIAARALKREAARVSV